MSESDALKNMEESIQRILLGLPTATEVERQITSYWVGFKAGLKEARRVLEKRD